MIPVSFDSASAVDHGYALCPVHLFGHSVLRGRRVLLSLLGRARRSTHIVGGVACAEELLRPGGLAAKVHLGPIPPEGPGW